MTVLDLVEFDYEDCRDRIRAVRGDIRIREDVAKALEGADVVVHTAAALPLYKPEDIYSTDVEGTRIVMEESVKAGVKRIVHISTTAVYGIPDHHPLFETDRLFGVGPYGEAKVAAEKVCEEFRSGDVSVPILRPKSFIGPERLGVFALLYEWARDGHGFPVLGKGTTHTSSWTWRISVTRYGSARRFRATSPATPSTSVRQCTALRAPTSRPCWILRATDGV